ncbi:MAG: hypothetical protein HIU84_10000 [Acidobacteria bacterium]|nr:hypothetical protein [Acidobacteriota bacterium]
MSSQLQHSHRGRRSAISYLLLTVLMLGSGLMRVSPAGASTSHVGPEGVLIYNAPDLANSSTTRAGAGVDGISCRTLAKATSRYHIHAHVAVFVKGKILRLPAGVGITKPQLVEHYASGVFDDAGIYDCLYWLHTHTADGIIHVEAPAKQNFTLGQFFDIWNQPLSSTRVGPDHGKVTVFENGKRFVGDPRSVPLLSGAAIQLDVGNPVVPFKPFKYTVTGGCGEGTSSCKVTKS